MENERYIKDLEARCEQLEKIIEEFQDQLAGRDSEVEKIYKVRNRKTGEFHRGGAGRSFSSRKGKAWHLGPFKGFLGLHTEYHNYKTKERRMKDYTDDWEVVEIVTFESNSTPVGMWFEQNRKKK